MTVVFFVAADFAILRALWETDEAGAAAIITLPMINLLILTLPRLKGGIRLFWVGFQAVGCIMTLVFGYLAWFDVKWFFWPGRFIERFVVGMDLFGAYTIIFSWVVILYTTPLVLLAALGGWLSARYRVTVGRRRIRGRVEGQSGHTSPQPTNT
jgi:hypothetical protein